MKPLKTQAPTLSHQLRNRKPKCDINKVKRHKRVYKEYAKIMRVALRYQKRVTCVYKKGTTFGEGI